jgi:hypothetical protein
MAKQIQNPGCTHHLTPTASTPADIGKSLDDQKQKQTTRNRRIWMNPWNIEPTNQLVQKNQQTGIKK